jgi:hypothetical protein
MSSSIPEALIILVPLAYIVIVFYVLRLVTRLVKAVERIADKVGSTNP